MRPLGGFDFSAREADNRGMFARREFWRAFSRYKASAWALIAANCMPVLGVLFLGWDAFAIIGLYWVENVIIGAINVLKIITCSPDPDEVEKAWAESAIQVEPNEMRKELREFRADEKTAKLAHHGQKLFLVPFFIFHYGLFCMVHGAFIMAYFGRESFFGGPLEVGSGLVSIATDRYLGWAVAALAGSHLYSFFRNYLRGGEYRRTLAPWLMIQPYGRVVLLHVAILFGGFVVLLLGSNIGVLLIWVVGKTFVDLIMHLHERQQNAAKARKKSKPIMPEQILDEAPRSK